MNCLPESKTFTRKPTFTREDSWPCSWEPGVKTALGDGCPGYWREGRDQGKDLVYLVPYVRIGSKWHDMTSLMTLHFQVCSG